MMNSYELADYYRKTNPGYLENAIEIGRRIEYARKKVRRLTQLQLSELVFTSERNYRRWVKDGKMTFQELLLISAALNMNPMAFLAEAPLQGTPPQKGAIRTDGSFFMTVAQTHPRRNYLKL